MESYVIEIVKVWDDSFIHICEQTRIYTCTHTNNIATGVAHVGKIKF